MVAEYNSRLRLAKMGFADSLEDLDGFTADCFLMISAEIDKVAEEEMKKASKRK